MVFDKLLAKMFQFIYVMFIADDLSIQRWL